METSSKSEPGTQQPQRTLMQIPIEIRREIYYHVAAQSAHNLIPLLCTSSQIHREAMEILYRRPLSFNHQDELIQFSRLANPDLVHLVTSISIRLQETDVSKVTPLLRKMAKSGPSFSGPENPYTREAEMIVEALSRIGSQIKQLSVHKPLNDNKAATCDVYQTFFLWVLGNYTQLESLQLGIEKTNLIRLPEYTQLKSFHYSGFSTTSGDEILQMLRSIPRLEELKITGPPKDHAFRQRAGFRGKPIIQSLTPIVMAQLPPLKRISICEIYDPFRDEPAFLTGPMFVALGRTHSHTLQALSITTDLELEQTTLDIIQRLIQACTGAQEMQLAWPDLDMMVLSLVPPSLHRLEILDESRVIPLRTVAEIEPQLYRLPNLRSLCLLKTFDDEQEAQEGFPIDVVFPISRPWSSLFRCHFFWMYWTPIPITY